MTTSARALWQEILFLELNCYAFRASEEDAAQAVLGLAVSVFQKIHSMEACFPS